MAVIPIWSDPVIKSRCVDQNIRSLPIKEIIGMDLGRAYGKGRH